MITDDLQADIEAIEGDLSLHDEANFDSRLRAIDDLEFKVIDRIEGLLQATSPPDGIEVLKDRAARLQGRLEEVDERLFQGIRADIRAGRCTRTALRTRIVGYVAGDSSGNRRRDEMGYDDLDVFVNGLLLAQPVPTETVEREPEMVPYQQTPARIIFELVDRAGLGSGDTFFDLGSGLGQVPILVNLLSAAVARGIELEPAYCDYARACAADLGLSRVAFEHADARRADYAEGTVFFMYTPFEGQMLQDVLDRLREESRTRRIRLFTYGPCTPQVMRQPWLACADEGGERVFELTEYASR